MQIFPRKRKAKKGNAATETTPCNGTLALLKTTQILQTPCTPDSNGNIRADDSHEEQLLNTLTSQPHCQTCGPIKRAALKRHGLSADWRELD